MQDLTELINLLGINLDEYKILSIIPKIKKAEQTLSYEEVKRITEEIYALNSDCKIVGSHSIAEMLKDTEKYSNVFDVICRDEKSVEILKNYLKNKGYRERDIIEDYSLEIFACNKNNPYECFKMILPTCFGEVSLERDGIKIYLYYDSMVCIKYSSKTISVTTIKYVENAAEWTIANKLIRGIPIDLEHLRKLIEFGISIEEILSYVKMFEPMLKEIYPDYKKRLKRNLRKLQKF